MISSNSVLVTSGDSHWAQTASGARDVLIGGKPVRAKVVELRGGGLQSSGADGRWLAWQVYWIDGHWTASDAMAKALTVWSRLRGRGDDSAVVLIYGRKGAQDPAPLLDAFATDVMASVQSSLELTRASR